MTSPWAERPFIVIWEVTRACALACRHCRAEAIHRRDPRELRGAALEGFLDQLVPTGRAKVDDLLSGEALESLFEQLYALSLRVPTRRRATASPRSRSAPTSQRLFEI